MNLITHFKRMILVAVAMVTVVVVGVVAITYTQSANAIVMNPQYNGDNGGIPTSDLFGPGIKGSGLGGDYYIVKQGGDYYIVKQGGDYYIVKGSELGAR